MPFWIAFLNWSKSNFYENGQQKGLTLETKQFIHDGWTNNSIPFIDCRNGCEFMKIKNTCKNNKIYTCKNITNLRMKYC